MHALPEAALLLDRSGRVVDLNQQAEKLMARDRHQVVGTRGQQLFNDLMGGPQSEAEDLLGRVLHGESVHSGRRLLCRGEGDALPVTAAMSPVRDTSGETAGALIAIIDLSEVTNLERELEHGERHLAVGEMTAGLVHDFSNVLSTISDAVMVLDGAPREAEHDRAVLGIIRNAVRRGGETIGNVRNYLAGKSAERSPVDLRELLEEVLEVIDPVLNTRHGIEVRREMEACGAVAANQDELRRAFTNLVLNALDAMPEGGTLTVRCRRVSDKTLVSVSDTGAGMPPEIQKKIFSAYFTTKSKGTGLGLVGARRTIEAQRGNIRFESTPGRGTTFYVTLPAMVAPEQPREHDSKLQKRRVS